MTEDSRPPWAKAQDVPEEFVSAVPADIVKLLDERTRLEVRMRTVQAEDYGCRWELDRYERAHPVAADTPARRAAIAADIAAVEAAAAGDGDPVAVVADENVKALDARAASAALAMAALENKMTKARTALRAAFERHREAMEAPAWTTYTQRRIAWQRLEREAAAKAELAAIPLGFVEWVRRFGDGDLRDDSPCYPVDPRGPMPEVLTRGYVHPSARLAARDAERARSWAELEDASRRGEARAATRAQHSRLELDQYRNRAARGEWIPVEMRHRIEADDERLKS